MTRGLKPVTLLSLVTLGDEPPSEFRIFSAGKVETTKGTFVFDAGAAKSVMAAYKAHGTELMIDYDHASLDIGYDPAESGKAAGWFAPEVRNAELWAVNVRWTPKAAEALRGKEWRYMSPAFGLKDGRITNLLNVALTNMPATNGLEPLMAANQKTNVTLGADSGLPPKLVNQALEAVASKDSKGSLDLLKQILAQLLGGSVDPDATTEDAPPPVGDGGADESQEMGEQKDIAASRIAMSLTGKTNAAEALAELARTHRLAIDLEKREERLANDREQLEAGERRSLVGKLVALGVEIPATAWSDDDGKVPVKRLQAEPISDLRSRVEKLSAAGVKTPKTPKTPADGVSTENVQLTPEQMKICEELKCDPKTFAILMTQRDGAKKGT